MGLTFLTPLGALVGVVALVPLAAIGRRELRAARLRRALGLASPPWPARLAGAVAVVTVVGLLAIAAAQPALRDRRAVAVRRDAQVLFVVDISRSMLAARGPNGRPRLARAVAFAERLRSELADLPAGIATLTDRPLPSLFPSSDAADFEEVAERSIAIEQPPPAHTETVATDFGALTELATQNYFGAHARHRLVVLLSDGESGDFDARGTAQSLREAHIDLIVVRFWHHDERIYDGRGRPEPGYRPDAAAHTSAAALARLHPFGEGALAGAAAAARRLLRHGPAGPAPVRPKATPLSSYAVAAAGLPLAFLLFRNGEALRLRRRSPRTV